MSSPLNLQKFLATIWGLFSTWPFFYSFIFSTKISLKAAVDQKTMCFFMPFTSSPTPPPPPPPPPPPRAALPYLSFLIILSLSYYDIWNQRAQWKLILAACSKVFLKASLCLMKEQVSLLAKSAVVQYVSVFRLILAKRVKYWSRAWDGKALYCQLWCGRWRVSGLKK